MSAKLVSAIVPSYNRASLLRRAVESALNQTHDGMEVIVVDDGSTDQTPAVMNELFGRDSRVRYIRVENGGVSRARNIAMSASRGEFVAFLDSDDYWLPWKIELQVKCLERVPAAGMIWTNMTAVSDEGSVLHTAYLRRMYSAYERLERERCLLFDSRIRVAASELGIRGVPAHLEILSGNIFSQMLLGNLVHTSTTLLTRERLSRVGGFREDLMTGEDYDFHLRTCREGPVAFVDVESIGYTIGRADQLTSPALAAQLAQNTLRIVEPVLRESAHLIRLPEGAIARMLAETHAWAARTLLDAGRHGEARAHGWKSIRYDPVRCEPYGIELASLLPPWSLQRLRTLYRLLKARLRG